MQHIYQKIATYLNKKGIPTPSQSRNFANAKQTANWKAQHIVRILDDRRYIGDYVGGHTEKVSFKSKKTRVKDKRNNRNWQTAGLHKTRAVFLLSYFVQENGSSINNLQYLCL